MEKSRLVTKRYIPSIQHSNPGFTSWLNASFSNYETGRDFIEHTCRLELIRIGNKKEVLNTIAFIDTVKRELKKEIPEIYHEIIDKFPNPDIKIDGKRRKIMDFFVFFHIQYTPYIQAMGTSTDHIIRQNSDTVSKNIGS